MNDSFQRFQSKLTQKSILPIQTKSITSLSSHTHIKKRKLIILGKIGSGKSSLINRFVKNSLPVKPQTTNEEIFSKNYIYKNEEVKLIIIDTAGQSEYTPGLPNRHFIGVHGFILTYSIDDNHSFEVIQHINRVLLEGIGTKYIPRILVGNKKDLEAHREVSIERIKKLSHMLKCPYLECSALQGGEEIEKIFYKLLKEVDKETNDEYPYDIKNSTIEMNYIRKNHKSFNIILLVMMGILLINNGIYITSFINIVLFILIFFNISIDDKLSESFKSFNLATLYIFTLILQIWCLIINHNLEPLYKEFYSSISINQQLLQKV